LHGVLDVDDIGPAVRRIRRPPAGLTVSELRTQPNNRRATVCKSLSADGVPQRIVNVLESVQIPRRAMRITAVELRIRRGLTQPIVEQGPIGQIGQLSCNASRAKFHGQLACPVNIMRHHYGAMTPPFRS